MILPPLHEGSHTEGNRTLFFRTYCPDCPDRKDCRHNCGHAGLMRFLIDGQRKVFWSGIIDYRKIKRTVRDYLEHDELPADVAGE